MGIAYEWPDRARRRQGGLRRMLLGADRDADSGGPAYDQKDAGHPGKAGTEAS